MSKDNNNIFIGQPILKKIYKFILKFFLFDVLRQCKANRYYQKFTFQEHVITGIFGVLLGCSGLREIIVNIHGFQGKLKNVGLN